MQLTHDQAAAVFALLPTGVRAAASMRAIGDTAALGRYVGAACAIAASRGVHVTVDGAVATGDLDVPAEVSEARFVAAATADPSLARAADSALKALLSREERSLALVRALYAGGFALDVDVVRASG